jgi:hypothetical protein
MWKERASSLRATATVAIWVPWLLAAQHRKLVSQHQDLDLLGLCRPEAKQDQLKAAAQRQVDERPDDTNLRRRRRANDGAS